MHRGICSMHCLLQYSPKWGVQTKNSVKKQECWMSVTGRMSLSNMATHCLATVLNSNIQLNIALVYCNYCCLTPNWKSYLAFPVVSQERVVEVSVPLIGLGLVHVHVGRKGSWRAAEKIQTLADPLHSMQIMWWCDFWHTHPCARDTASNINLA